MGIIYLTPARKYETIRASKRVARALTPTTRSHNLIDRVKEKIKS